MHVCSGPPNPYSLKPLFSRPIPSAGALPYELCHDQSVPGSTPPPLALPRQWPQQAADAIIHAIAMARVAIAHVHGGFAASPIARVALGSENARLRSELTIATWVRFLACNFTAPPMMRDRDLEQVVLDVERHVNQEQQALVAKIRAEGGRFMGVKAVLAVDPFSSPDSVRPKGKLNPRLAAGGDSTLLHQGKKLLRSFRELYREAWHKLCAGAECCFPAGTYLLRRQLKVECAPLDAPWCAAALSPS